MISCRRQKGSFKEVLPRTAVRSAVSIPRMLEDRLGAVLPTDDILFITKQAEGRNWGGGMRPIVSLAKAYLYIQ